MKILKNRTKRLRNVFNARKLLAAVLFCCPPIICAETILITTSTNVSIEPGASISLTDSLDYQLSDDAILTFTGSRAGTGGAFDVRTGFSLSINPVGESQTGKVIFENFVNGYDETLQLGGVVYVSGSEALVNINNAVFRENSTTSHGGAFYITQSGSVSLTNTEFIGNVSTERHAGAIYMNAGWLSLNNVTFTENWTASSGTTLGIGGALVLNNEAGVAFGDTIKFIGNHSYYAGAVRNNGTITMSNVEFSDNYATAYAGALHSNNASAMTHFSNVLFANNRAGTLGGAIANNVGQMVLENAIFTGNWAGELGGAIYATNNAAYEIILRLTDDGSVNRYNYVGNSAGGGLTEITEEMLENNIAPAAVASAGGFYYVTGSSPLTFDIAEGVVLEIGDADATDRAVDSIASGATTGRGIINKNGEGTVILHADNAYYTGTVNVSQGRLLLGNDEARLGGIILVREGAFFGGGGTVTTIANDETSVATTVTVEAGGGIQVGTGENVIEKLVIDGDLSISDATVSFVAFDGTHTQLEVTGEFEISGSNTVNLQSFATGTYNLGAISSLLTDSSTVTLTLNGVEQAAGGRQTAELIVDSANLIVDYEADIARVMNWTGATSGIWNNGDDNWTAATDSSITKFAAGDVVVFSSIAGSDINVELASNVAISGMEIWGAETTLFSGNYSITASAWQGGDAAEEGVQTAGGKLIKYDSGTLIFNNRENSFAGGIDLHGGMVVFTNGAQLRTPGSVINFIDSATLQADGGDTTLENNINIGDGKSAVFQTNENTLTLANGSISGASGQVVKIGSGTLVMNSANAYGGGTELKEGALVIGHSQALGSGTLTLSDAGSLVEVAGGLSLNNDIDLDVENAEFRHGGGSETIFTGRINGSDSSLSINGNGVLNFTGDNSLKAIAIGSGVTLIAGHANALGGADADVTVANSGVLAAGLQSGESTVVRNLTITGGTLDFRNIESYTGSAPILNVGGTLTLSGSAVLSVSTELQSNKYTLVSSSAMVGEEGSDYVFDKGSINENKDISFMKDGAGSLVLLSIDQSVNPGKDIAVSYESMMASLSALRARLNEDFLLPTSERAAGSSERSLWIRGIGSFGRYDATPDRVGYADDTYGAMVGYDIISDVDTLFGMFFGVSEGNLTTTNKATTELKSSYIGMHGAARFGKGYVSAEAMYVRTSADSLRWEVLGFANGSYKSLGLSGSAEVGMIFGNRNTTMVKPSFGVHYMNVEFGNRVETGPGAMIIDEFRTDTVHTLLSIQTTQAFKTPWGKQGLFDVRAGWRGNLKSSDTRVVAAFLNRPDERYTIDADEYIHNTIMIGAGIRMELSKHSMIGVSYDYEMDATYTRNTIIASLRLSW